MILEAEDVKTKVLADLVSGEGLLSGSEMTLFSLCLYKAAGSRDLCGVSLFFFFSLALSLWEFPG